MAVRARHAVVEEQPTPAGTLGSIAAHGFLNLDPLLVGALNSTDGGEHPPLTPAVAGPPVSAGVA